MSAPFSTDQYCNRCGTTHPVDGPCGRDLAVPEHPLYAELVDEYQRTQQ